MTARGGVSSQKRPPRRVDKIVTSYASARLVGECARTLDMREYDGDQRGHGKTERLCPQTGVPLPVDGARGIRIASTVQPPDGVRKRRPLRPFRGRDIGRAYRTVSARLSVAGHRRRRRSRFPARSARRAAGRIRIVAPNEMPKQCAQDDRAESDEETQYLIDPVHSADPPSCLKSLGVEGEVLRRP